MLVKPVENLITGKVVRRYIQILLIQMTNIIGK